MALNSENVSQFVLELLRVMRERNASDLFFTVDFPPAMKIDGKMTPVSSYKLKSEETECVARYLIAQVPYLLNYTVFEKEHEANFAIHPSEALGRFRVNVFVQQGRIGMVLRPITTTIPNMDALKLPPILKEVALTKRGLVIFVGGTGSGKSTSLAAMIDYRNAQTQGHIITIEDPIEFVHEHKGCLITQREVGADTNSWQNALKNTLRQAPDVILIGEIRDRETMDYAIAFAETGHLCLATLHANSANQAIDRIINFFPEERRAQLLMDLSLNLKAFVSQRLIAHQSGKGRAAAVEILLNSPLISDLIFKGEVHTIKEVMAKSRELGMQTFDQALFDLYTAEQISLEDALRNADSVNDLRLKIKLDENAPKSAPTTPAEEKSKFRIM